MLEYFLYSVLGVRAILDVWFLSSLFAERRAGFQAWRDGPPGWRAFLGELFSCRFCLSVHVSSWISLFGYGLLPAWWLCPLWSLGITGGVFILEEFIGGEHESSTGLGGEDPGGAEPRGGYDPPGRPPDGV